jgi:uncharacterized membrane protein YraQ (UPF0718 family)
VSALLGLAVVSDVGDGLREGFFMFWETLWALVLGFGLSGAVQAFVSKDAMQRVLGDHRAPAVTRSSLFGMASSSCSYAAAAMARSLVRKGADFTTAMVFMFASTNLVIELGIVLVVLLGWQFAAAEFAGGFIMIVLLALVGGVAFNARFVARTRAVVGEDDDAGDHCEHHHDHGASAHSQVTSARGWGDAAGYAIADVRMLWKELLIGYTIAGMLGAIVPVHVWNDLFLHGHGFLTTIENVIIGPFIAVIAFVCSVGNVALAAALWRGGIGFGGIISFIFADLIALPLLLVYRKYYGGASMWRMLVTFWALMSIAGLAVEGIFQLFGAVPDRTAVPEVMTTFHWNYTTVLNIVGLVVVAVLLRLRAVTREPVTA